MRYLLYAEERANVDADRDFGRLWDFRPISLGADTRPTEGSEIVVNVCSQGFRMRTYLDEEEATFAVSLSRKQGLIENALAVATEYGRQVDSELTADWLAKMYAR